MIDPTFLEILCCPDSRQPLEPADAELLRRVNEQIDTGRLLNRGGQPVTRRCEGGLVRRDRQYLYPICEGIPVLLVGEAIPLAAAG